jgi:hypothetical protein
MAGMLIMGGAVAPNPDAREAILAIVGGALLTIVLTRPRLRWLERLTEHSTARRRWAERALSALAFVMGGYAWATLFLVLQKQLGSEYARLVKGAGFLIVLYAGLIHFEPFLEEWRRRGAVAAGVIYVGCAFLFVGLGVTLAEILRTASFETGDIWLLVVSMTPAGLGALAYWRMPRSNQSREEQSAPDGPSMESRNTANITVTSGPTRTPARSTRA